MVLAIGTTVDVPGDDLVDDYGDENGLAYYTQMVLVVVLSDAGISGVGVTVAWNGTAYMVTLTGTQYTTADPEGPFAVTVTLVGN